MYSSGLGFASASALAMVLGVFGCMAEPGHGEIVAQRTNQPIQFYGYHDKPGVPVTVEAPPIGAATNTLVWKTVGSTTTSSTPSVWTEDNGTSGSLQSRFRTLAGRTAAEAEKQRSVLGPRFAVKSSRSSIA
jgi:hypothetical protein